jgi:hypothetical protein
MSLVHANLGERECEVKRQKPDREGGVSAYAWKTPSFTVGLPPVTVETVPTYSHDD